MKTKRRITLIVGMLSLAFGLTAGPAFADHPHVLQTPGTCVDRAGQGFGTGQEHDQTSFHSRVHKGTPGLFAFEQDRNPVSVEGDRLC
jgi:hypothetical protein